MSHILDKPKHFQLITHKLLPEFVPPVENVMNRNISVTLADFKFSADAKSAFDVSLLMQSRDDEDDDPLPSAGINGDSDPNAPGQDFFGGEDMGNDFGGGDDYFGGGDGDDDNDAGFGDDAGMGVGMNMGGAAGGFGPAEAFDPHKQGNGSSVFVSMDDGQGLLLDHFDEGYLKNWAGPEHWKLRRVRRGQSRHLSSGSHVHD